MGWLFDLSRENVYLHLWPTSDAVTPKNTGCYVNVTEVENLYIEYLPLGVVHPNGQLKTIPWGNEGVLHSGQ